jgi:hypothetical protein
MQHRGFAGLVIICIALIIVSGCMGSSIGTAPDPIVGHWGGLMGTMYISLDAYPNGTADWSATGIMIGTMSVPGKWVKNPNGTYTLFTQNPALITISDDQIVMGDPTANFTLLRGLTYKKPN